MKHRIELSWYRNTFMFASDFIVTFRFTCHSNILKLRVAEDETKKAIQFIDESQVLVTESLPFGGDADPTLAMDLSGDALPHSVHDMMQRGEAASSSGEKPGDGKDGKDGKDGPLDQHMDGQPVARLAIKTYTWFSMYIVFFFVFVQFLQR